MRTVAEVGMAQVPCTCGIVFWVPERFDEIRRQDGATFYCPVGHHLSYTPSELEKTKRALAKEKECCERKSVRVRELEYQAQHPDLSEAQHAEAQWLVEHVKGFGWSRAEAAIREFGRVRAFAAATAEEAAHGLSVRLHRNVSPEFAGVLVLRTTEAVVRHGQKLLPAEAGPSNL